MAITALVYLTANSPSELQVQVAAKIADDYTPHGPVQYIDNRWVQAMVQGSDIGTFEDLAARVTLLETNVDEIDSWADALATKLNADATAQNALSDFPLTLDTDYAALTLST